MTPRAFLAPFLAVVVSVVLGVSPAQAQIIDWDGDFNGDVFLNEPSTGNWALARSDGAGAFSGLNGIWAPGWTAAAARFDAGALTDMFLFNAVTGQWFKMTNSLGLSFTVEGTGFWWPGWQRYLADLDGDGLTDVFLWDPASGVWFKCLATPGGFTYTQGAWTPGWELYPARFNNDGLQDFFLFNRLSGQWFWALGANSAGGFTYPATGFWSREWAITAGDFDGDGLSDLLLVDPSNGTRFVARTSVNTFVYFSGFFTPGFTIHAVDLDADDRTDLFMHHEASGQWFQMVSDGFGSFGVGGSGFWSLGWTPQFTDLNGDGRDDIVLYNVKTGQWFQARNFTLGTFAYTSGFWNHGLQIVTGPLVTPPPRSVALNGSFEQGAINILLPDLFAGSTAITHWSVLPSGISYWLDLGASHGRRHVRLTCFINCSSGGIEQFVDTIPGLSYRLRFDLGGNGARVRVTAGLSTQQEFDSLAPAVPWATFELPFVASGLTTRIALEFAGLGGPTIDHVRVIPH